MKILVHDYSGHPFQVQLSRSLSLEGHDVLHLFSASIQSPRGALEKTDEDPDGFSVKSISLGRNVDKYSLFRRRKQEREYGELLYNAIECFAPDVVIASNTPPDAFQGLIKAKKNLGIPYVYWL